MSIETHPEAAGLAEVIRHVTDLWDEPLDEVRDVPQIVNAVLAAGYHRLARLTDDDVVEAAAEAMADRNGWDSVTAVYYDDIRAVLATAAAVIGGGSDE